MKWQILVLLFVLTVPEERKNSERQQEEDSLVSSEHWLQMILTRSSFKGFIAQFCHGSWEIRKQTHLQPECSWARTGIHGAIRRWFDMERYKIDPVDQLCQDTRVQVKTQHPTTLRNCAPHAVLCVGLLDSIPEVNRF